MPTTDAAQRDEDEARVWAWRRSGDVDSYDSK